MDSTKVVTVPDSQSDRVEGKHPVWWRAPSLQEAVDRAIEKASGADALIDVTMCFQSFLLYAFKVVGTPIPIKEYSAENSDELIVTRDNINGLFDGGRLSTH